MIGVRGIESLAAGDDRPNLFRTLGPTLLISMGYLDLGKWLATLDAGSRFGYDLVLLVLLFNFSAILFQYQSIRIGLVTGKDLTEICQQEYSQMINVILGVQAGLCLVISELTMVAGVAVGFNLVFDYGALINSLCFSSVVVNLMPYVINRLSSRMAGTFNACISGFTILCFVLGLLVSQPKVPVNVNAMFPNLSGESVYSLMALLGGNVLIHNFYIHSSVAQVQRRCLAPTLGSVFHDHLFSILFVFTGVFLMNYVLLSSAADESGNITIASYQDGVELMNQMFVSPMAPVLLLVILIFSSHIISLTSTIGSDVILKNTFGIKLPDSAHHLLLKGFAIIPCIYCGKVAGFEGMYQLLIICPVFQAMFLPSAVIPLICISSSRFIMGSYKIALCVEIFATLAFLLMLFTNIIFAAEILFGDSTWTNNLKGNTERPVLVPHIVVALTSFASIAFALFLAVTPLKSASNEAESEALSVRSHSETLNIAHYREETSENVPFEEVLWSSVDVVSRDPLEDQKSALEHKECSDTTTESGHDAQEPASNRAVDPEARLSPSALHDEPKFEIDWTEPISKVCTDTIVEQSTADNIKEKSVTEKIVRVEPDVCVQDSEVSHDLEIDKSNGGKVPSFTSGAPPSLKLSRGNDADAGNVSGFVSKQSGLGRAARRQLAAILDEFWGNLFDYHGKVTQEANTKRFNFMIGLDLRAAGSAGRKDRLSIEASRNPMMRDAVQGSAPVLNTWGSRDKDISNPDTGFGLQMGTMGSPTWSQSMHLPNRDIPSSGRTFLEQNDKLYSNFHTTSYSGNHFYQPATIHGYQLANYLKGTNASRNPYSSTPLGPWQSPRSSESAIPNYTGSVINARTQNLIGSLGASSLQSPTLNLLSTMTSERSYCDPISIGGSESVGSSVNSKKYHSLPDISAVIAATRDALLNETNLGGPAANLAYLSRLASEKSRYVDLAGRPSSPLAKLSQHNVQRDMLSMQSGMNTNTKSLWSQQPFEQLFGASSSDLNRSEANTGRGLRSAVKNDFFCADFEAELLKFLRICIMKLLKLEGSEWLFSQNGGCDENLIDQVSEVVRVSQEETSDDRDAVSVHRGPNCGHDCIWRAPLVVSFGVWCIHRVLDLSRVESRPELWGKYTYVLNRLQGIIDPSFSNPRKPLMACACLPKAGPVCTPIPGSFTTAAMILEVIKGVEQAVSGRKGRSGTAAGDVAFPKGKENLASVLKRYERRLANKKTPSGR